MKGINLGIAIEKGALMVGTQKGFGNNPRQTVMIARKNVGARRTARNEGTKDFEHVLTRFRLIGINDGRFVARIGVAIPARARVVENAALILVEGFGRAIGLDGRQEEQTVMAGQYQCHHKPKGLHQPLVLSSQRHQGRRHHPVLSRPFVHCKHHQQQV